MSFRTGIIDLLMHEGGFLPAFSSLKEEEEVFEFAPLSAAFFYVPQSFSDVHRTRCCSK